MKKDLVMNISIKTATAADAPVVAFLVNSLLSEIMERTGGQHFSVTDEETTELCRSLMEEGKYAAYLALDTATDTAVGCMTLCEAHALYARGTFGIIQELYISPDYRSRNVGAELLARAVEHAETLGWKRLELCTPPLPEFARALSFYEKHGFEVTGGRKMKFVLPSS